MSLTQQMACHSLKRKKLPLLMLLLCFFYASYALLVLSSCLECVVDVIDLLSLDTDWTAFLIPLSFLFKSYLETLCVDLDSILLLLSYTSANNPSEVKSLCFWRDISLGTNLTAAAMASRKKVLLKVIILGDSGSVLRSRPLRPSIVV